MAVLVANFEDLCGRTVGDRHARNTPRFGAKPDKPASLTSLLAGKSISTTPAVVDAAAAIDDDIKHASAKGQRRAGGMPDEHDRFRLRNSCHLQRTQEWPPRSRKSYPAPRDAPLVVNRGWYCQKLHRSVLSWHLRDVYHSKTGALFTSRDPASLAAADCIANFPVASVEPSSAFERVQSADDRSCLLAKRWLQHSLVVLT